eukprot:450934_1
MNDDNTSNYDTHCVTIPLHRINTSNSDKEDVNIIQDESDKPQITLSNYISDFKRQLHVVPKKDGRCACLRYGCCNLWVSSHFRLLLNICIIVYWMYFVFINIDTLYWMHYIFIGISGMELIIIPIGLYGLYYCNSKCISIQMYSIVIEWLFIMFMLLFAWGGDWDWYIWTIFIIFFVIEVLSTYTWLTVSAVRKWAKYFENGGIYDPNLTELSQSNQPIVE